MKRFLLIVLLLVSLLLPGCGTEQSGTASPYISDTSAEDCYLCGGRIEDLIPSYWGQNNIGCPLCSKYGSLPCYCTPFNKKAM